jgi:hypothetical protein
MAVSDLGLCASLQLCCAKFAKAENPQTPEFFCVAHDKERPQPPLDRWGVARLSAVRPPLPLSKFAEQLIKNLYKHHGAIGNPIPFTPNTTFNFGSRSSQAFEHGKYIDAVSQRPRPQDTLPFRFIDGYCRRASILYQTGIDWPWEIMGYLVPDAGQYAAESPRLELRSG